MAKKRLVPKKELEDEIVRFLWEVGEKWTRERDVERFITELYKKKISGATARRYVEAYLDDGDGRIRVGRAEDPETGRSVRVVKPLVPKGDRDVEPKGRGSGRGIGSSHPD